ncbi:MAG: DMT family transporter [Alkalinema sp. RU_4_3]|nr:DMT family transporter [Alkalinema sp. RU_4_3]
MARVTYSVARNEPQCLSDLVKQQHFSPPPSGPSAPSSTAASAKPSRPCRPPRHGPHQPRHHLGNQRTHSLYRNPKSIGIWLQQIALQHVPTGIAQTLGATSPLFILPMVALMGERVSRRAIAGALLAFTGVATLVLFPSALQ